jgi:hypothetical protein
LKKEDLIRAVQILKEAIPVYNATRLKDELQLNNN